MTRKQADLLAWFRSVSVETAEGPMSLADAVQREATNPATGKVYGPAYAKDVGMDASHSTFYRIKELLQEAADPGLPNAEPPPPSDEVAAWTGGPMPVGRPIHYRDKFGSHYDEYEAERRAEQAEPPPRPSIVGVTGPDRKPDGEAVFNRLADAFARRYAVHQREQHQSIRFEYGPVAYFLCGDLHVGSTGTDYGRIRALAQILEETPGARLLCVGDVADQMVIGKLLRERMHTTFSQEEEWAAVDYALGLLGPYLDAVVGGNHDYWTQMLAGFDRLRMSLPAHALYHADEIKADLHVGRDTWPLWLRHQFKGSSIYNPVHAEMRATKFDDPRPVVLVSGHTHPGVNFMDAAVHGHRRVYFKVGAFKKLDGFARRVGFPRHDFTDVGGIVFDGNGDLHPFRSAEATADYMRALYGRAA